MKKQILAGLLSLAAVSAALGQAVDTYVNDFVLTAPPVEPPQVDARNFVNNNTFIVDLWYYSPRITTLYSTRNTCNYTNNGMLGSTTGFRFDRWDSAAARYYQAGSLYNEVGATIDCGGTNLISYLTSASLLGVGPQCRVWATNIVNRGTIKTGVNGLLSLQGQTVDLAGGLLSMEGFESGQPSPFRTGIFDYYWGIGRNDDWTPGPFSPSHWVTNRYYNYATTITDATGGIPYSRRVSFGPSNFLNQVVYVLNGTDPNFTNNVYFSGPYVYVEWNWGWTNTLTDQVQQDYMYLVDSMNMVTNLVLNTNGVAPPSTGYRSTYVPTNFLPGFVHYGSPIFPSTYATPPGLTNVVLPTGRVTNDYASYMAIFEPFTLIPGEVANQSFTNMGGGIEISADKHLDLTSSRIGALNYLRLTATNHFDNDGNTRILTEVGDFNLGCTNGLLTVTNLMAPTCPRLIGNVYVYSARWTNITDGVTNAYTWLLVDSALQSSSPTLLQNLSLHSTNVVITDVLNVASNLLVDAENLTIATNGPDARSAAGELNLLSGKMLWTNSFPRLHNLTNYGGLSVSNAAFFGGMRTPPFYPVTQVEPYWNFINYGTVRTLGCSIWATNVENYGLLDAGSGSLTIQAGKLTMSNGVATAATSDISLYGNQVNLNNQALNAGRKLVLWATNLLDDGGAASSNFWTAGVGGFSLPIRPAAGRLTGTTITETTPPWANVNCQWAGEDRGAMTAGYDNNAALGRLVLYGGANSAVMLQGTTGSNALYVDCLELHDYATNRDASGNLVGLKLAAGMKLYYSDVLVFNNPTNPALSISMAEKLNRKNGGALNWVSAYAGAFSSTNVVYPDGTTNLLNRALVTSTSLDSDGDGIVNIADPSPCLVPSLVRVTVETTGASPKVTRLSWGTIGSSTNHVFYKTSAGATNWTALTNFVWGPANGQASVLDPVGSTNRYYRVRVDVRQP